MTRARFSSVAVVLFIVFALGTFCFGFEITIDAAPETLNLLSEGVVVTVHTDIPFGAVNVHSVYLNGILIQSWKADNQGNFVAKFSKDTVKADGGLEVGLNEVLLTGLAGGPEDPESFWGVAEILVLDIEPVKKGKQE